MIGKFFRYASARLNFPESFELGFPRMGVGIAARAKRFADDWSPHLERSRAVQRSWVEQMNHPPDSGRRLLLLGAGRLLDVDLPALCGVFTRICFVDADPLCRPAWSKAKKQFPAVEFSTALLEISGKMSPWSTELRTKVAKSALEEIPAILQSVGQTGEMENNPQELSPLSTLCQDFQPDALLSLNLLSQIPVMWRDVIESILVQRYGRAPVVANEKKWFDAHIPSGEILVRQHLAELSLSSAKHVLLISDLQHLHYDLGATSPNEISDALYGVDISSDVVRQELFPGWQSAAEEPWLWTICPPGAEPGQAGIVNRVGAYRFWKS